MSEYFDSGVLPQVCKQKNVKSRLFLKRQRNNIHAQDSLNIEGTVLFCQIFLAFVNVKQAFCRWYESSIAKDKDRVK